MGSTSIRVSEEAKRRLDLYKEEDESYDEVIRRLTSRDKWAGFGALADGERDTREGLQQIRSAMQDGIEDDMSDEQ